MGWQKLEIIKTSIIFSSKIRFFFINFLNKSRYNIYNAACFFLKIINLKIIIENFLDSTNLARA